MEGSLTPNIVPAPRLGGEFVPPFFRTISETRNPLCRRPFQIGAAGIAAWHTDDGRGQTLGTATGQDSARMVRQPAACERGACLWRFLTQIPNRRDAARYIGCSKRRRPVVAIKAMHGTSLSTVGS